MTAQRIAVLPGDGIGVDVTAAARQVLDAVPPPVLATHEVGRAVGSPRVNGPQLVLPLPELERREELGG